MAAGLRVGSWLSADQQRQAFAHASEVAASIPVYRLEVPSADGFDQALAEATRAAVADVLDR